ncbi:endonuclease III domain-containing protein [Guyparkeria sp.]|uniref:endonuclease III domain-containing protein n=1 Tax=Guyparkeria sp. TaxID=2035736 RepID=UPI0039708308
MPWWPAGFARTPAARAFEIAVGAVLTQNTNWRNVERAMANLERDQALDTAVVRALPDETLAELIRPSGFYRIKTGRLKALATAWEEAGGYPALADWDTATLRGWLLGIHGVGRETADDILLYGFARPVWVIDAYTRRLIGRLGFEEQLAALPYDELAARLLANTVDATAERLAAWHGLIVEHAKAHCRVKPTCADCPLQDRCAHGRAELL